MIPNNEFVLLCGAGISVSAPSNAPLWGPMRDAIIKMSIDRIIDNSARWDQPFPMKMEAFAKNQTLKEIAPEVLFQILHSSLAHIEIFVPWIFLIIHVTVLFRCLLWSFFKLFCDQY